MHRLGLTGVNLIEHADLIERVNSPLYKGPAWWEPNTGILNPAKLSREWRRVLDGAGVPIYENTPVLTMDMAAGRQRLRTRTGPSQRTRSCLRRMPGRTNFRSWRPSRFRSGPTSC